MSLLSQAKRAILCGTPGHTQGTPEKLAVDLPVHVANYLLDAIYSIEQGTDAATAFGLKPPKGRPSKQQRDMLIRIELDKLRQGGTSLDDALNILAKQFNLSASATHSAYNKFSSATIRRQEESGEFTTNPTEFLDDLKEMYGHEVADEFLGSLKSVLK